MNNGWWKGTCPFCKAEYSDGLMMHLEDCYPYIVAHKVDTGSDIIVKIGTRLWSIAQETFECDQPPVYSDPVIADPQLTRKALEEYIEKLKRQIHATLDMIERIKQRLR